jgi:hypothetical protein
MEKIHYRIPGYLHDVSVENLTPPASFKNEFDSLISQDIAADAAFPDNEAIKEYVNKKTQDFSYGEVDLRALKASNLSDRMANIIVQRIAGSPELISECSEEIAETENLFLKNFKLFTGNKSFNLDPNKWFAIVNDKQKYIIFGKYAAVDFDENVYFNEIGLGSPKDRAGKLAIVKEFHEAVKSGVNARIKYAVLSLKENLLKYLWDKNYDLITAASHAVYWAPAELMLLNVYNEFFGITPLADWFLYPYRWIIRHNFSQKVLDKVLIAGPPLKLLRKPPFGGNLVMQIGIFIQYTASLFGGKITLTRHGKSY